MSHYQNLVSRIQSRISLRANTITNLEQWKLLYKAERNYGDMSKAKASLRELEASQKLDKVILKEFEAAAYAEKRHALRSSMEVL